ncbi:MAG: hypothetical protein EBZ13_07680, partial [Planctomycetia bacterium]|nr:hypothetical protein [Planctomycetia bacterium]
AASLTGAFGRSPQKIAEMCVEERLIHFIASDAHDTKNRPFGMRDAYDTIIEMADQGLAELVCCENPAKVVAGDEVAGGIAGRSRSSRRRMRGPQKPENKEKPGGWLGWFGR